MESLYDSFFIHHAKLEVLKMWEEIHGDGTRYQLAAEGLGNENVGVHPLYMGIRYANALWKLESYPIEKAIAELKTITEESKEMTKEKIEKSSTKKTEKIEKIPVGRTASMKQMVTK